MKHLLLLMLFIPFTPFHPLMAQSSDGEIGGRTRPAASPFEPTPDQNKTVAEPLSGTPLDTPSDPENPASAADTSADPSADWEKQPLNLETPVTPDKNKTPSNDYDPTSLLVNMALGLLVFIVITVVIVWLLRRNPKVRRYMSGAVEVVSRSYLGSRYSVFVLKVGDRLIVVGQGPEGMRTLSEITAADEVTRVLASVRDQHSESMHRTFRDMLGMVARNKELKAPKSAVPLRKTSAPAFDARISDAPENQRALSSTTSDVAAPIDPQAKLAAIREHLEKNKARLQ